MRLTLTNGFESYISAFGDHLRKLLEEKQLNAHKVSLLAGIPYKQVERLVKGKNSPALTSLLRIAVVLQLPPWEIIEFSV